MSGVSITLAVWTALIILWVVFLLIHATSDFKPTAQCKRCVRYSEVLGGCMYYGGGHKPEAECKEFLPREGYPR